MNREQLAHIVRAAARIAGDGDIIILGSQSVLGLRDADSLPAEATMSIEADIAFRDDPDGVKADRVDGAIGELSSFHEMYGYYAQGVSISTAVLPVGWEDRVVPLDRQDAHPGYARCLETHDLVVAKLVAGREKDVEFAEVLIAAHMVDPDVLEARAATIDRPGAVVSRVTDSIRRCARKAAAQAGSAAERRPSSDSEVPPAVGPADC